VIVVADTSAISNLLTIGREGLLREVFGQVIIPSAVEVELRRWHAVLPTFLVTARATAGSLLAELGEGLDPGETEAIALGLELHADLLLIDERKGRAAAARLGLKTTGLLGVLLEAKALGLIERASPILDDLTLRAGFHVSVSVRREFLCLAGESAGSSELG
jgi:predicted nucleic acid-binding protein